jgi:hypothetical protein
MALRKSQPLAWSPHGASDTLDSSTSFPGSMAGLQNLIPDPSTDDLWQCRPAALLLNDPSTSFTTPTFISCTLVIGNRLYGMMSTARNPGQDEPFAYNILTNSFTAISGVTAVNTPISPPISGAWNPPTMALVGTKIIVAHQGFTGAGGSFFGVIDTTNPNALTWTAQNTTINPLVAPPQWVSNFNGRCYFLVNPPNAQPGAYFSDVLIPTQITNANQVLTFGDNVPLTVSGGLALFNQLGGIIQSLMVFKGVANIYQITGDAALNNLTLNTLNVATGTLSPNSLTTTTKGLAFLAPDGLRVIDFNARVSDPIGRSGRGITIPFFFSLVPSRANASFNGGVYRAQVQNGLALGSPQQEWWYDMVREEWSGPHTTKVAMIEPYANTFLITSIGQGAKIYQSDQVQSNVSTFVEYNVQLLYIFQTAFLPNTDQMSQVCIIEATLQAALVSSFNIVCAALDQNGVVLDIVTIAATGQPTIWGQFTWGQAFWGGAANALAPRQLLWKQPLVFQRLTLAFTGSSAAGIKLGRLNLRYQLLGYLLAPSTGSLPRVPTVLGIGSFTLNPNATTTVVAAPCTAASVITLQATTPDAGNDAATTSIAAAIGSFTVTHANNPRADRTFNYVVTG